AARIRFAYADLAADRLGDKAQAAAAYEQVAQIEPGNRRAVAAFAKLGGDLGMWSAIASAVVRYASVREAFDDDLLGTLEIAAKSAGAHDQLTEALKEALDKHKLPGAVAALFHHRLALLHRDQRQDRVAAIHSMRRAL